MDERVAQCVYTQGNWSSAAHRGNDALNRATPLMFYLQRKYVVIESAGDEGLQLARTRHKNAAPTSALQAFEVQIVAVCVVMTQVFTIKNIRIEHGCQCFPGYETYRYII